MKPYQLLAMFLFPFFASCRQQVPEEPRISIFADHIVTAAQLKANGIIQRAFYSNGGRAPGEARLDAEGMQTMRALANNLVHLLHVTGGQPAPGRCDEPWTPMHFIR